MKKAERTTRYIIEKVAPIFNKKGVYGTSLNDLTSATELTKGSIYGNFQNKDDLAEACYQHNLKFLQRGFYHAITLNGGAKAKLFDLIQFYRDHFHEISSLGGCPIMNAAIEADDGYPLLRAQTKDTFSKWRIELVNILKQGQTNQEFQSNFEPHQLASTFIAMIEGGLLLGKTLEDAQYFYDVLDSLENMIEQLNQLCKELL